MDEISNDWLSLVEGVLAKSELLPALEEEFPFPWEEASGALQKSLEMENLSLSCASASWREPREFLRGMGDLPSVIAFELSPIEGTIFLVLSQADIATFTTEAAKEPMAGPKLKRGFYHFLLLKILKTLDELAIFDDISFRFLGEAPLPEEKGFCIDVACALTSSTVQGRIICSEPFLEAVKEARPLRKKSLLAFAETSPMDLTLRCEVGSTSLKSEEWQAIQPGDFLVLDRCSFDPTEEKGSLTVCLGKTPLFVARLKSEGLKVLDFAFYREAPEEIESANPEEPSLQLTAEVGQLQIRLKELLHLKTESMLQLSIRPEQGIEIIRDSVSVAKAELLKLGQVCGARILNLHG